MRRLLIVVGLLAVAGCSQFSDLFTAHADVAARAGALELKTGRLAQILAGPKGAQLNREAAEYVGNLWTDYALFAQAVAKRALPADSADVANVLWAEIADIRSKHWFDTLLAARSRIAPGAPDSVYQANEVRIFQHILFRVEPNAVPEERAAVRKKAEGTLTKVRAGADFGQLASQLSEDPGSAADSGFLPPKPRGSWVTAFDSAGWSLAPGAVSGIVETPFGYHIIKRPASAAVQPRIAQWLRDGAGIRLDSIYLDSLGIIKKVKIASGGPATLRAAVQDMDGNANSHKTVASYQGGDISVAEMLRWIHEIPPAYIPQIKMAGDSQLVQFIRQVTNSSLMLRQADSAKVALTPSEWSDMRKQYLAQVDSLRAEMGMAGSDITDSTVAESERVKVAGLKLDQYFDALLGGKTRLRPMPATLAVVLRARMPHKLYEAGLTRGLDQARVIRAKSDSTNNAPAPKPGAMQPAPGPAPVVPDSTSTPSK